MNTVPARWRSTFRLLPCLAAALCGLLVAVAEAPAREVARLRGDLIGPKLTGAEVGWIDQECGDCFLTGSLARFRLMVTDLAGSKPPRRLARGVTESRLGGSVSVDETVDFELSSTALAIRRQTFYSTPYGPFPEPRTLRFGARGSRPPIVLSCDAYGEVPYAVDGDRLLYYDACDGRTRRLVLFDRRTEERRTLAETGSGQVRLAGDYAAHLFAAPEGLMVIVRRVPDGSVVYSVPVSSSVVADGIELDASGRLAVLVRAASQHYSCAGTQLSWYSVAEPYAHALPVEPCPSTITWAGERIVYEDAVGAETLGTQIRAVALDSRDELIVDSGRVALDSFDADESTLAYGLWACDGGRHLYVVPLAGTVDPTPAGCPTGLASRNVRVAGRRARIELSCPRGCSGTITIQVGGRAASYETPFSQRPRRGAHPVRLDRRVRRRVMARGRVSAVVRIRFQDRSIRPEAERVTRRVTLTDAERATSR